MYSRQKRHHINDNWKCKKKNIGMKKEEKVMETRKTISKIRKLSQRDCLNQSPLCLLHSCKSIVEEGISKFSNIFTFFDFVHRKYVIKCVAHKIRGTVHLSKKIDRKGGRE